MQDKKIRQLIEKKAKLDKENCKHCISSADSDVETTGNHSCKNNKILKNFQQKKQNRLSKYLLNSQILRDDYSLYDIVGKGSVGAVLLARYNIDKGIYAIKVINFSRAKGKETF